MTTPTNDCGKPTAATPASMAGDSTFASPTTATSATSSSPRLQRQRGSGRRAAASACVAPRRVARPRRGDRQEEVAVPDGLGEDERAVQHERGDGGEGELGRGELGAGRLVVKVGSTRLSVASVVTVASAAPVPSALKTATPWRSAPTSSERPTMPLQRDHDRGEHGVAGERRRLRAAGDHQRDDQRHLDDGHRDGEHQRPEGLTDPVRDDLGVVHGGQHRARRGPGPRGRPAAGRGPSPRQRRAPRRPRPVRRSTRRERRGVSWQPWPQPFQTTPVRPPIRARRRGAVHDAPRAERVSGGRSGPPRRCGTCRRGHVGAGARRSRRTGGRAAPPSCGGMVDTLAQCGRAAYGASAASTAGRTGATAAASGNPGEVEGDAVALVRRADPQVVGSDGADLAALHHRRDQGASARRARQASRAASRGTKYSDCSSSPLLGVNSTRKCASRSCHGPATPSCGVQLPVDMPGVMWRGAVGQPPTHPARLG